MQKTYKTVHYFLSILLLVISTSLNALQAQEYPLKEFRGVWISTVVNLDYPLKPTTDTKALLKEFEILLNDHENVGINAVFVQVRPACDAIYKSKYEPWSQWLTGKQGQAPTKDPLPEMIKMAHDRGMEFHAWLNPYRAVHSNKSDIADNHVSKLHPEWIVDYHRGKLLNPGLPEVTDYITRVVRDLVDNYDIDGIHFDDYFYPYPHKGEVFDDSLTFVKNNRGYTDLGDWRRANINLMMKNVYANIKSLKPHVKFGVSPFGVWRNQSTDPEGSATKAGIPSYDSIYADTRKWLKDGIIDYVTPQLYWSIGLSAADYSVLVPWWSKNVYNRHLYIGQSPYKINNNFDKRWEDPNQIPSQITLNRQYSDVVKGQAFFRSQSMFANNMNGFLDSLSDHYYKYPAIIPAMPWIDNIPPNTVRRLKSKYRSDRGVDLRWKFPRKAGDKQRAYYYIVYRMGTNEKVDINDPSKIIYRSNKVSRKVYFNDSKGNTTHKYIVVPYDRNHNAGTAQQVRVNQ